MKIRLWSILLLLCFLGPLLGSYAWLQFQKMEARKQAKAHILRGLDRSQLCHFQFSPAENQALEWEGDDEFEWRGNMYDVVEVEIHNGQIHYWCWLDDAETEVERQLERWIASVTGQDHKHNSTQARWWEVCLNVFPPPPSIELKSQSVQCPHWNSAKVHFYSNPDSRPPTPPPRWS